MKRAIGMAVASLFLMAAFAMPAAAVNPAPVRLARAQAPGHSVDLTWNASTSTVIGYDVYRGLVSGGPYTLLSVSPVMGLAFTDTNSLSAGFTYFYVVTAVDASGNQSVNSNEASAVIPSGQAPGFQFTLSAPSLSWTAVQGGANPACQTVTVADTTASGQHVPFSVTSNVTWLPITAATPASGSTAQTISLCPAIAGWGVRVLTGAVTITATGPTADGSVVATPAVIAVKLTLTAPATGASPFPITWKCTTVVLITVDALGNETQGGTATACVKQ